MTAANTPADAAEPLPADASPTQRARARSVPRAGWAVVANKEFADHLLSVRFVVLLIILGLAVGIPFFLASEQLRSLASQASGQPALFLALFQLGINVPIFQIDVTIQSFIALAAPLLGLAFAFDAVNGERAQGTLPRLLSQPIYRDDVINGKFAAGLAMISLVLAIVVAVTAALGIFRVGIVPAPQELLRIVIWLLVTIVYVGFWLAFGLLLSVVTRRAATSALVGFGVWFLVVPFGRFLVTFLLAFLVPTTNELSESNIAAINLNTFILRLLPTTLYNEVSRVLLNPTATYASTPPTVGENVQVLQQAPSLLSLDQSFLLVWPHIVVLVALTVACFAIAYVRFMRQEVRA
ncbi:MAG: ABC transporter permease [Chloroflexota bacterium]